MQLKRQMRARQSIMSHTQSNFSRQQARGSSLIFSNIGSNPLELFSSQTSHLESFSVSEVDRSRRNQTVNKSIADAGREHPHRTNSSLQCQD